MKTLRLLALLPLLMVLASGCKYYRQDIILRVSDEEDKMYLKEKMTEAEQLYRVRVNDRMTFKLYTNKGELLVDPNGELARQLGGTGGGGGNMAPVPIGGGGSSGGGGGGGGVSTQVGGLSYLVEPNGVVVLPMIGPVQMAGLRLREADSLLAKRYGEFYKDAFVTTGITNRRAFLIAPQALLGGGGGGSTAGTIITLQNESMNLIEVLAQTGIGGYAKMDRIRIIRGDLTNPEVFIINLQHISTLVKHDLTVRPNDIIYIEPGRRPFFLAIQDIAAVLGFLTGLFAFALIYRR